MRRWVRGLVAGLALCGLACGGSGSGISGNGPGGGQSSGQGQLYALMASNEAGQGGRILHYSGTASLSAGATPVAQLSGPGSLIRDLADLDIDPVNDRLFAASGPGGLNPGAILVWDSVSTKNGEVPPNRVFNLGVNPISISYDASRDRLYVGTSSGVFRVPQASTANGTIPSGLPITGQVGGQSLFPFGLQLVSSADILYLSSCSVTGRTAAQAVVSYDNAVDITGQAVINRTLTSAQNPFATTTDAKRRLVVNDAVEPFVPGVQMSTQERILVFNDAPTASGNPAPVATITGAAQFMGAHRLSYDTLNDSLVVANTSRILFFDRFTSLTGTIPAGSARALDVSGFVTPSSALPNVVFGCTDTALDPTR